MDVLFVFFGILAVGIGLPVLGALSRVLIGLIGLLNEWLGKREGDNYKQYGEESLWRTWFLCSGYGIATLLLIFLFAGGWGNQ